MLNIRNAPQGEKGFIIMNDLKIWNYEDAPVRTVEINHEIWFVAKDVATILGYAKPRNAVAVHVDDEDKKDAPIQGDLGGTQMMTIINESGVYALIFGSKLPDAKKFKHWVTHEVLPEIRKMGTYGEFSPLLQLLIVSDGITTLGTFAFNYCNNLKSASLPNSLTKIGRNAFAALATEICGITKVSIPSKVTEIGQYAFANTQITSLTIPHTVTAVEAYVCYECFELAEVRYEGKVIGAYMFMECTSLTDSTIAETVKEIQACAFCSCNKLKTLNYEGSLKDWTAIEKQQNWDSLANLTKIQCFDGYLRYDTESGEWEEVKENA